MSSFLKNIARRAAGLPAEIAVSPSLPPAIMAEPAPAVEATANLPSVAPPAPLAPSPVTAPAIQRRADAAPPAPSGPAAAPVIALPLSSGPMSSSVSPAPPAQRDLPVHVPVENAVAAESPVRADSQPAAILPRSSIHAPATLERESLVEPAPPVPSVIEHKHFTAAKPAATLPGAIAPPTPKPRTEAVEVRPAPVVPPPGEKATREIWLEKVIDRIYGDPPAPASLSPAGKVTATSAPKSDIESNRPVLEPSPIAPRTQAVQPRTPLSESGVRGMAAAPAEKRSVNVRIGALELKLSAPAAEASAPAPPEAPSGFEGFDEVRSYRF